MNLGEQNKALYTLNNFQYPIIITDIQSHDRMFIVFSCKSNSFSFNITNITFYFKEKLSMLLNIKGCSLKSSQYLLSNCSSKQ